MNIPVKVFSIMTIGFSGIESREMPPIRKVDHDVVCVEYDIKAKGIKLVSRKNYRYKHGDIISLKVHMTTEDILQFS